MSDDTRKALMDSKPKMGDYPDLVSFEEALSYWMSHQGRILAMTRPSPVNPAALKSPDEAK